MSVAVATDPTISYNNDGGSNGVINPTPQDSWKWGATSGTTIGSGTGSFFQLQDSSNGAIKNLTLVFDKLTDPTNTPTQAVTEATSIKTLTITGNGQVSGNNAVFTISNSGSGKGILLGAGSADDTRGTLTFNFLGSDGASKDANWNYTNDTHKRKIILNLTDSTTLATSNQKVSLVGDILIKAGKGIRNANDLTQARPNHQSVTNTNEFEATFGEDMIGNISIKPSDIKDPDVLNIRGEAPYSTDKQSGYRDIKSTFTFTAGSLNGNILSEAGENTFTFNGSNVKIDGSITANNGYYDTSGTWGAGSENEYVGGVNIINFTQAGTITGNISANVSGQNKITFSGNGTILGKIISGKETSNDIRASSANHNNLIIFNGSTATIGASTSTQASIIVNNKDAGQDWSEGRGRYSNNTIVFNSTANNIYLDKLYAIGEVGTYSSPDFERINLNILSFNNDSATNTLQANEIKGSKGSTIIGKNLYSSSSGEYDSTLFEEGKEMYGGTTKYKATGLYLKNDFVANFLTGAHTAKGTYTLGVINGGATYINVENLTINKDSNQNSISSNNGGSHIYATTLEIKGNVSASGGSGNTILVGTSGSILGNISAHDTSNTIKAINGTLTIGASGAGKSVNMTASGRGASGINTITANTLNAYFGTISAGTSDGWINYSNTITANNGTINATSLTTAYYTGGGFPNPVSNSITLKQGSLTIGSITTSGNYGTDNKNIFTLGESGAVTTQVTGTINTSGNGAKTIFDISNASSTLILGGNITANDLGTTSIDTEGSITFNGAISSTKATNTITAKSGTATIAGISTLTYNGSKIGNTINLGSGSVTINARSGETDPSYTDVNGKAIYAKNGNNSNTITAETILVNGEIYANSEATNSLTASSSITVTGNIGGGATNNLALSANSATLTLNGKTTGGTSHDITSLTATSSGTNTLTLDNSAPTIQDGAMATTIRSVSNGENLAVVLKGNGSGKGVTLTLNNATGTTLKSVAVGTSSTENTLAFNAGSNSVDGAISIGADQALNIDLAGTSSLNLIGGFIKSGNGVANINVKADANATLSGGAIEATKLTFAGASTLTINNSSASFADIEVNAGNSTLAGIALSGSSNLTFKADGTALTLNNTRDNFALVDTSSANSTNKATLIIGNGVNASIDQLKGANLKVGFNGGATLKINGVDATSNNTLTLASVSMGATSTNNTLDLSNLADSVTSVNFASAISVGASQGLSIKVKGLSSSAGRNIVFEEGISTGPSAEKSALAILDGNATLSATTGGINLTNLDISANNTSSAVTFLSSATIETLTAQADKGSNLIVGNASDKGVGTHTPYSLTIGTTDSTLNSVTLEGGDTTTLTINGGTQTINTLTLNASANGLTLSNKDNLTIGEIVNNGNPFNVALTDSTLSLAGDTNEIDSLKTDGKSLINLAVGHIGSNVASKASGDKPARNTLTIGELNGDLSANIFVSKSQADRIVINNATNANSNADTLTLYARGNAGEIISITSDDNVLVADTSMAVTTNSKKVDVKGGVSDIGGLVIQLDVKENQAGSGLWYVGETIVKGVDKSFQEVASTALTVNYDLFLANFNSLNKRMGELRGNANSQGVWARVFGGAMSNDFGSGSKSDYITAQAGYDYALTFGNAKNYVGVALAYGSSWTKANDGVGLSNATLDNINSNMVEVGVYNSYVMDNGWYNDTIFKFDYIMSDFDISASGNTSSHSTNNFAMILSDEFGYRYKFAENEKGNWYIDPQVEVAFGYFNQSDFNQAIAGGFTTVEASQDAILTLRARAGASLGKKFITEKGFASLYVGAFYEYDYIEGGNAQTQTLGISNSLNNLESNGRAIVNVGSNIELTEGVRMYIDVEKSFGDKQRTFMQFNLGARYSF